MEDIKFGSTLRMTGENSVHWQVNELKSVGGTRMRPSLRYYATNAKNFTIIFAPEQSNCSVGRRTRIWEVLITGKLSVCLRLQIIRCEGVLHEIILATNM